MPVNISIIEGDLMLLSVLSEAIDSQPEFKCVSAHLTLDSALRDLQNKELEKLPTLCLFG
jgi:response regulator of citrate/malate metabolism